MEEQAVSKPRDGSLLLQMLWRWPIHPARCGSPADPPPRSRDGGSPVSCSPLAAAGAARPPAGAGQQRASTRGKGSSVAGRRPPARQSRRVPLARRPLQPAMGGAKAASYGGNGPGRLRGSDRSGGLHGGGGPPLHLQARGEWRIGASFVRCMEVPFLSGGFERGTMVIWIGGSHL